jgi:hypothetical protein
MITQLFSSYEGKFPRPAFVIREYLNLLDDRLEIPLGKRNLKTYRLNGLCGRYVPGACRHGSDRRMQESGQLTQGSTISGLPRIPRRHRRLKSDTI